MLSRAQLPCRCTAWSTASQAVFSEREPACVMNRGHACRQLYTVTSCGNTGVKLVMVQVQEQSHKCSLEGRRAE